MSDLFVCPDCEQPTAAAPDSLCDSCGHWRAQKMRDWDEEYRVQQRWREQRRMSPGARFGEALADMAKAAERSRR